MQRQPAEIINLVLDSLGADYAIGSFSDGTKVTEAARRQYWQALIALLECANWPFARVQKRLELLGDTTLLQNAAQPQTPPPYEPQPTPSPFVEQPWTYAYAWPLDCVRPRWMPVNYLTPATNPPTNPPLTGALPSQPFVSPPLVPARFLCSTSDQYPIVTGAVNWEQMPDLDGTLGTGPIDRRIILADQPCALLVYTKIVTTIEMWAPSFEQAMVAYLAQRLARNVIKDRAEALKVRDEQIAIARQTIGDARAQNANEAGAPQTINREPDWIRARNSGPWWGGVGGYGGWGVAGSGWGWGSIGFSDGSVF